MRNAESVTFGSSALNRAAEQRNKEAQALLLTQGNALVTIFWRGKPLFRKENNSNLALAWVSLDSDVLTHQMGPLIFLGINEMNAPLFVADISTWSPEELPETLNEFLDPSEQKHPALNNSEYFGELRRAMTHLSARDAELAVIGRGILEWHKGHSFCSACGHPLIPEMAGWQLTCTRCKKIHFPRTDPVVIMLITHGNNVLMGRSHAWPSGMYSLLAGFVEPGETLEAAVRREVFEEANIRVGDVGYLTSQPWPFPASLMFGCEGKALTTDINIDRNELEDAQWVSREEMLDVFEGVHPKIKPARTGAIAHFLLENWMADTLN